MKRRVSSSESGSRRGTSQDVVDNIRTKPPHIYDNITRRLLQLGVTLAITTFIGLIVRYAVQEFDPSVSTITVTTSRVNNRDIASLSVSKNFLERILEFVEESIAIVAAIIPLGFPLCTIFNRHLAKIRAGSDRFLVKNNEVLNMIPKYIVIGDAQACQMPDSNRLRPLVRDTIYFLIKARMKPKLISEDSYEEARKLGIRIGLIKRDHHKLAVIKSVDLLKNICDSRGDIKQGKVRYLLSRMKIMSQSTPADKSLLLYLMKHCESLPNENIAYLGYSFTDPEAMRIADCSLTFQDCDDDDVKKSAHVIMKSENITFTDIYLFIIVCLIKSNITQSYALYQISTSVSACIYRFLSITVFQEQLISHSQFGLLIIIQQVFAIFAIMTKWISSLPQEPLRVQTVSEMSHAATEDTYMAESSNSSGTRRKKSHHRHRSATSISGSGSSLQGTSSRDQQSLEGHKSHDIAIPMQKINGRLDDTLGSSSLEELGPGHANVGHSRSSEFESTAYDNQDDNGGQYYGRPRSRHSQSRSGHETPSRQSTPHKHRKKIPDTEQPIHLSGADLDQAIINSKIATNYKQTFHSTSLIDGVTYRLAKLHIAYQVLVMIIIMIFAAIQVCLTELNAFGLENLNPTQWFVCFVFAFLSALIAPLTGQQRNQRKNEPLAQKQLAMSTGSSIGTGAIIQPNTPTAFKHRPPSVARAEAASRGSVSPSNVRSVTASRYTDDDDGDEDDSGEAYG